MKLTDKTQKDIRTFGIGLAVILAGVTGIHFWKSGEFSRLLSVLAVMSLFLALFFPVMLLPVFRIFMLLGKIINFVVTHLVMTVVFYLILTPISLFFRLRKKHFMPEGPEPALQTYWEKVDDRRNNPDSLKKQF